MHPRVLDARRGAAQERAVRAAKALAEAHGLDGQLAASLAVYDRDPDTRAVMRAEAVADLLEALAGAGEKGDGKMTAKDKTKAENDDLRAQIADLQDRLKRAEAKPATTRTASK